MVTAVYEPYITTLASATLRDGHAAVLAEGKFRDGDCLRANEVSALSSAPDQTIEAWGLQIPEDGQDSHTIRWRIPADSGDDYAVYILQETGWKKVSSEQIGAYLCFAMTGSGQFSVAPVRHTTWWVWAPAVLAAFLFILFLTVWKKQKQTHPKTQSAFPRHTSTKSEP